MKEELTYSQAIEQLDLILRDLENGQVEVDELMNKATKAMELLKFCNSKLKKVENDLDKLLVEMD